MCKKNLERRVQVEIAQQHDMSMHQRLLDTLHECEAICEYTEASLLMSGDIRNRAEQLRLLRDCADMCSHTARSVARHSGFAKSTAALCAQVCKICGDHCLRHRDQLSQDCGRICLHCADECNRFAMTRM